jgi:hypothetical protein
MSTFSSVSAYLFQDFLSSTDLLLYLYVSQGQLTMLTSSAIKISQQASKDQAVVQQTGVGILSGWSKDKLDSLFYTNLQYECK